MTPVSPMIDDRLNLQCNDFFIKAQCSRSILLLQLMLLRAYRARGYRRRRLSWMLSCMGWTKLGRTQRGCGKIHDRLVKTDAAIAAARHATAHGMPQQIQHPTIRGRRRLQALHDNADLQNPRLFRTLRCTQHVFWRCRVG